MFFKEISRFLVENFKIPGVLRKYGEIICFSTSFPGFWQKISKFQEFSRRTEKLSVFQGVFQVSGRKFQNSRSFSGIPGVVSTMVLLTKSIRALPSFRATAFLSPTETFYHSCSSFARQAFQKLKSNAFTDFALFAFLKIITVRLPKPTIRLFKGQRLGKAELTDVSTLTPVF